MTVTAPPRPAPVPASALDLLERAERGLLRAERTPAAGERYVEAHLAALRGAAAVIAVRGRPSGRGPANVWSLLPRVAPELGEWAAFFAAGAPRRAAVEAGRPEVVSPREADDLVRDVQAFTDLVAGALGLSRPARLA
jgi:SAV_6107-like HEPN